MVCWLSRAEAIAVWSLIARYELGARWAVPVSGRQVAGGGLLPLYGYAFVTNGIRLIPINAHGNDTSAPDGSSRNTFGLERDLEEVNSDATTGGDSNADRCLRPDELRIIGDGENQQFGIGRDRDNQRFNGHI